jgi:F0F1-type ATP synthase gamma subunit
MKTRKDLVLEEHDCLEMKGMAEVFEEIAAIKMQRIRMDTTKSRDFFEGLGKLSEEVGLDMSQMSAKKDEDAAVYISANKGMYGDIVDKIFTDYLNFIKSHTVAPFVVGKVAIRLMSQYAPEVNYSYFELSDEEVDMQNFGYIMRNLIDFRKIYVFYGKFQNLANQDASSATVSGEMLSDMKPNEANRLNYLYEPSVAGVSKVFNNEILSSVMEQIMRESQLAKFGSRLMFLDSAIENIDGRMNSITLERRHAKRRLEDKKKLMTISGIFARR